MLKVLTLLNAASQLILTEQGKDYKLSVSVTKNKNRVCS